MWSEIQQMLLFCIPVYWDGGPLNLQVFLLRHKELADFYVGTCWKQTPVCPGWMPGRAPALYKPPPPKWQRHWQGKIKNGGLKQCVKVTTLKFGCTWILQGNMWETPMQKKRKKEKKSELMCCKMRDMVLSSHSPASSLLHTLVAIQNAFEQLCH